MTPVERRAAIDAIGWSVREVARRAGKAERTVRGWLLGEFQAPPEVDEWLKQTAVAVAEHRLTEPAHPAGPEWGTENENHTDVRGQTKAQSGPKLVVARRSVWVGRI